MSTLVFSPKFVIETLLAIPFNRLQVNHLQKLTGKSERTIYYWFEQERIPKRSDFLALMEIYNQELGEQCEGFASPINGAELIRSLKDPDWNSFAMNERRANADFFPITLNNIRCNLSENIEEGVGDGTLRKLGNCLPPGILKKLRSSSGEVPFRGLDNDARDDLVEVFAIVFFLTLLEAEYFKDIGREDSFLENVLPSYFDQEKGVVNMPIELFFQNMLKTLVAEGMFGSKRAIAEEIEDWMELESVASAYREFNRYMNDSKIPSWKTFNEWIPQFYPDEYQGKEVDKEAELVYAQNLFGACRILDQTFRLFIQCLSPKMGGGSVDLFKDVYSACRKKIVVELSQGGPK